MKKTLLILSIFLSLASSSCAHGFGKPPPDRPPRIDLKLYTGDYKTESIRRNNNDAVSCSMPELDDYVCMTHDKFQELIYRYRDGCKRFYNWAYDDEPTGS
jgi:hypothetical protein